MEHPSHDLNLGFMKFASIELSENSKLVAKAEECGATKGVWVATEKIHGANFSLIISSDSVKFAKRTALLAPNENFFGYQSLIPDLTAKGLKAFELRRKREPGLTVLRIFGELFGGKYPHPDVAPVSGAIKVQEFLFYAPGIHFCAFDVHNGHRYADWDDARELLQAAGFMVSQELFRGSFEQCMAQSEVFPTTIPGVLGLPPLPKNDAEGLVIRPVVTAYFPNGSRVIFKKKAEAFLEVTGCSKVKKPAKHIPTEAERLRANCISTLARFVTMQRLYGAVSKIGHISEENRSLLLKELADDAVDDFLKENKSAFKRLCESDQQAVKKSVARPVFALVTEYLKAQAGKEQADSTARDAATAAAGDGKD